MASAVWESTTSRHRARASGASQLRFACRWLALAVLLSGVLGCGTVTSYASGCPGPLSGVLTDAELLSRLEASGQDAFDWLVITPDLPVSAVFDLLSLPLAMALERQPPAPISIGCYWATEDRDQWSRFDPGEADRGSITPQG